METYRNYFDLLELPQDAEIEDVRKNYLYLKNLYSGTSVEISALYGDFTQEIRQNYLSRLDEAYEKLCEGLENRKPAVGQQTACMDEELRQWVKGLEHFSGTVLREIRERLGVGLNDIHAVTRIQPEYLENIENEVFDNFRAEAYLRSYIVEYTRFLSLDSAKVLADYLPRYRSWALTRDKHGIVEVDYLLTKTL